ncbi:MAG TPA: dNTP triphosphohydrolase [Gemmataceae bacterium]|nr:dNTP triphosphohydrolase [Gemmataceae bacterium]
MEWDRLLCEVRIRDLYERPVVIDRPPEYRSQFERDYDRAVFSTPVRRLQDKAQVFPLEPHDAVRTRLTHSLEVSTVARDVARQAGRWLANERYLTRPEQAHQIETIAATCGLIHDLGNPPFGHAGEQAIAGWCAELFEQEPERVEGWTEQMKNDFLRFEGNAQTIRLVSKLQVLADDYGLNFTCGTLSAACKYTAASHAVVKKGTGPHHASKPGYFASEAELVQRVRERTGTGEARNPITYLVEACDDMVYSTVDLEDGVKKGVVDWQTVVKELMGAAREHVEPCLVWADNYISRAAPPLRGLAYGEAMAQAFRTAVIARVVPSVIEEFQKNYRAIMEGAYPGELVRGCAAAPLVAACKQFAACSVYCAHQTLQLELMGRRVIHDLMDLFWEAASTCDGSSGTKAFAGKAYALLSANYRSVFEKALEQKDTTAGYHRLQLVTDYVCGMTDTFACTLHRRLTNG